jgi:hypothetical protein
MRTRGLNDGTTSLLAVIFGSGALSLMLGPVYLQRHLLLPADALVISVPLYALTLSLVPVLLIFCYLLFSVLVLAKRGEQEGRRYRAMELLRLLGVGRRGVVTGVVLINGLGLIGYGISTYWYATVNGMTFNPGLISHSVTYDWSDVTKRLVSCHRGKGGPFGVLTFQMGDGQTLDLEGQQGSNFAKNFAQIAAFTERADSQLGDVGNCPCFIRGFVRQVSLKPYAAPLETPAGRSGDSTACR